MDTPNTPQTVRVQISPMARFQMLSALTWALRDSLNKNYARLRKAAAKDDIAATERALDEIAKNASDLGRHAAELAELSRELNKRPNTGGENL